MFPPIIHSLCKNVPFNSLSSSEIKKEHWVIFPSLISVLCKGSAGHSFVNAGFISEIWSLAKLHIQSLPSPTVLDVLVEQRSSLSEGETGALYISLSSIHHALSSIFWHDWHVWLPLSITKTSWPVLSHTESTRQRRTGTHCWIKAQGLT